MKFLKKIWPFIAIIFLIFPSYAKLLRSGFFPMQDDLQAFRVYEMDKCYTDLQIPCRWVPDAGYQYGYPQFNFYPPLPYYLGAALHRIGIQYIDTVKILFILGYVASAITMFVLVRSLLGTWSGFISAILYTYIPYKAVEVYVRGALSEFWAQIFFPLILWAVYKLIKTGKTKYLIWFAISVGALASTHTLMTMIFAPVAIVWAIYWLYRGGIFTNKKYLGTLYKVLLGGVLAFGLSAFFTLPVIFEKKFVHVESLLSGYFDYRQHFVSLFKLFISREWGYGSSGFPNEKLNLSLGIPQWIAGVFVLTISLINFKKYKKISVLALGILAAALFSIFMIHMKSSFIWAHLPFLWYLQFPWRFLAVSILLLSVLSGFAVYFSGKFKYIFGVVLVIFSVLLTISFFTPKSWLTINDNDKFSGTSWGKQLTISIFDYLPIYAKLPPIQKAPDVPEVLEGDVKFLSYKKGSNYQEGELVASKNSLIRIPLFDFPGMTVKVDGKVVSHVNNDCRDEQFCYGLITFSVPSGTHDINIKLENTLIRKIGNITTLISFAALAMVLIRLKMK